MQHLWKDHLTPKIHSLFDTQFKEAQGTFHWKAASDDIRVFHEDGKETPLAQAFCQKMKTWIASSKLNSFRGLEAFPHREVIFGCTQFIEDFHIAFPKHRLRYSKLDYQYYWLISNNEACFIEDHPLATGDALILSCPFTFEGDLHPELNSLLDTCLRLEIPVFLDGAWVGTCRDIDFDFSHPAIWSVGFSLSKGLGIGDQRIGVRFRRQDFGGSVSMLNAFHYLPYLGMHLGMHMMSQFSVDHLQNKYGDLYKSVCEELGLRPTKCIQLAHGDVKDWPSFDRTKTSRPLIGTAHLLRAIHEDRWKKQ